SYLVSAALRRIAEVTERYYQDEATSRWLEASAIIEKNLDKYYDRDLGYYIKGFKIQENGEYLYDKTLDASSIYPLFTFSKQLENQSHLTKSADAIERQLMNGSLTGVARYTDDDYLRNNPKDSGNPWFICTFWYVQYLAKTGHIERAEKLLEWTSQRFGANGMISEQIDPKTSKQLGVGPLIWSHAEYINCLILLRN
ncbi:hypothetical protein KC878_00705, partial [Candidatus Saccharibacteria bacterium]|nr:hypothetical protein [Candidatus Saccharibacteria bacterium]